MLNFGFRERVLLLSIVLNFGFRERVLLLSIVLNFGFRERVLLLSIVLNFGFRERVLLLCATDSPELKPSNETKDRWVLNNTFKIRNGSQ